MAHRRNNISLATSGITYAAANTTVAASGVTFPTAPRQGQIHVQREDDGDEVYIYVTFSDSTKDWLYLGKAI